MYLIRKYKLFLLVIALLATKSAAFAQVDTLWHVEMHPVEITGEREWENDTVRYHYNQMKYYVKTILPYLDEAVVLFHDIDNKLNDPSISKREQKRYVKSKQEELKDKFDDEIKDLNETQGVLLIKLIARQTGVNIYDIIKESKNGLAAIKWQSWSLVHGFNLNRTYNPDEEPWLEQIMEGFGYPLPSFYEERQIITAK